LAKSEKRLSIRNHRPSAVPRGYKRVAIQPSRRIEVTVVVRSKGSNDEWRKLVAESISGPVKQRKYLTRAEFGKAWGASRADLAAISAYGRAHGMRTVSDAWRRCVVFSGTVKQHQEAFGVALYTVQNLERNFMTHRGTPKVSASIHPMIEAILGLDTRPRAHPRLAAGSPFSAPPQLNLPKLRKVYAFPKKARGKGQCVAVIELGGGFRRIDYNHYFKRIGIKPPQLLIGELLGATNDPASAVAIRKSIAAAESGHYPPMTPANIRTLWTCETAMDLQIIGTLAPEAKLLLIFGNDDNQGQYHAITSVLADALNAPSVISCSWSGPEGGQKPALMSVLDTWFQAAAVLGITMCYSTGDAGDGTLGQKGRDLTFDVNFPASSPYVLACGGTTLKATTGAEIAWRQKMAKNMTMAGGGGFSDFFDRPPWQIRAGIKASDWIQAGSKSGTGRGLPDVSARADFDPAFSYITGGIEAATGGTSASAPLWAALVANLNQALGCPIGSINRLLYEGGLSESLRDITRGNIGHLKAKAGWDPATGWGSPNGEAMLKALAGR
jgi:kumamolisin